MEGQGRMKGIKPVLTSRTSILVAAKDCGELGAGSWERETSLPDRGDLPKDQG